ncbi:hypothetical protein D3C75_682470 [compost metagenome]
MRRPVAEGAHALGQGAQFEQGAAHGRVVVDRVDRCLAAPFRTAHRAHLAALGGVLRGVLPGRLGVAEALQADVQARRVHHHEHRRQAPVRLAEQPALGLLEAQGAGGAAADAQLVLDAVAMHRVVAAVGQQLGHQEQRDAAAARRRVGQAGEHQMEDVVGQVVLAAGSEDLAAGDPVAAVRSRLGAGAQQADVAAGLRFGQAHGRQDLAADDVRQVALAQLGRAMGAQALVGAVGDAGVHRPGMVGRVDHLQQRGVEQLRQALAAVRLGAGQRRPAAVDECAVGGREAVRGGHPAVVEAAALAVAGGVERRQHAASEASRFLDHLRSQLAVQGGEGRHPLPVGRRGQPFLDDEAHVAQRCLVVPHGITLQ